MTARPDLTPPGGQTNLQLVFDEMVSLASKRDRICFASHDTIAKAVGCSRRTVIRCLQELERQGRIERRDSLVVRGRKWRTTCWGFPTGTRRLRPHGVTQRTTCRRPKAPAPNGAGMDHKTLRPQNTPHPVLARVSRTPRPHARERGSAMEQARIFDFPESPVRSARKRDAIWDLLDELFGEVRSPCETGKRAKAVSELRQARATEEEIRIAFRYCKKHFECFSEMAVPMNFSRALHLHKQEQAPMLTFRERVLLAERGELL